MKQIHEINLRRGIVKWAAGVLFFVLLSSGSPALAFSLLGPYTDWMVPTNNFRNGEDIGGPMALGEGYRWNVPVVTYGFDQSFVDAFGTNGIAAVESAIAILNGLPPASQLDPSTFPTDTSGVNFIAASQWLVDLKSTTLFLLLEQLGLGRPTQSAFSIHDFSISSSGTSSNLLDLNFDPFSLAPSHSVNGVAYFSDFEVYTNYLQDNISAYTYPRTVDTGESYSTAVADEGSPATLGSTGLGRGSYFTGLTQDDVGGLQYLLSANNYKFETLLPDVHGTGTNTDNYVNLALRAGVEKITFVRQDYDLSGVAYVPLTNDFTDTYLTNGVPVSQQLERVISKPDFLFTAFHHFNAPWGFIRTGTTNWLNNAAMNGSSDLAGPGTIRPQVNISFEEYGLLGEDGESGDGMPFVPYSFTTRWASFDGSTNAPVIYPNESTLESVDTLQVQLSIIGSYFRPPTLLCLNAPVKFGGTAILQTSSNLVDWESKVTVTNFGLPVIWAYTYSRPQGFFRVVPAQ